MKTLPRILTLCTALLLAAPGHAQTTTDISTSPLEVGTLGVIPPNVMLLFDDSGSMAWDYMPDSMSGMFATNGYNKQYVNGGGGGGSTIGLQGSPPYYAYQLNGIFYNPNIYYQTPIDSAGLQYPTTGAIYTSYTAANSANWTKVPIDAFTATNKTVNLTTQFIEAVFCNTSQSGGGNNGGNSNNGAYPSPNYTSSTYPATGCKRNGTTDTGNPFAYTYTETVGGTTYPGNGYPDGTATVSGSGASTKITVSAQTYDNATTLGSNPFYFDIQAVEYCSDAALTTCQIGAGGSYTNAAPVRYCVLQSDQYSPLAVSGNLSFTINGLTSPKCQKKYNLALGYTLPRYGKFNRNDITPGTASYVRSSTRIDCTPVSAVVNGVTVLSASCSYAQEMTNFANWFAYYHTRIQMAKTAVGLAFNSLTSSYRVGMITINAYGGGGNGNGSLSSGKFVPIGAFNAAQKTTFYNTFYALQAGNSTPLREALSRVGWYYAGKTTGLSAGMILSGTSTTYQDPVQYSCQHNYTIMTTDGYWNGNGGQDLNGAAIGNVDNVIGTYVYRWGQSPSSNAPYGPGGYYDGNLADTKVGSTTYTSSATLADVAMYYYQTDLRPSGSKNYNTGVSVSTDDNNPVTGLPNAQVGTAAGIDENPKQHMVTYTIGLGVDGYLTYDSGGTYNSADVQSIMTSQTGCVWAPSGVCNWPQVPAGTGFGDDPAKDDDLWHAAVNGHGNYLSAKNPRAFYTGLSTDLALISAATGAAAAAATSTPNITATNNAIYNTTFETKFWDGQLVAQTINVSSGVVQTVNTWGTGGAQSLLDAKASSTADTRTIYTSSGGALVPFQYASLDATAQAWFNNLCNLNEWTQCTGLAGSDLTIVNTGANVVAYLRGQSQYADAAHFRSRDHILGDLVDSRPVVVATPLHAYIDAPVAPANQTYATWAASAAIANRPSTVMIGGNDGMLHAFDATTGNEVWAYVPRALLSNLPKLADLSYPSQHQFYVDGSPEVADVMDSSGYWHTILVAGYNAGGSGYFALDVTNPVSPTLLWEFCSDPKYCTNYDANLGLSFGNPVITKVKVGAVTRYAVLVTSGYNNNVTNSAGATGTGKGYLFELDPFTGAELASVVTPVTVTSPPSGLSRITAMVNNPLTDNTASKVYGGDLQGNLWRFDVTQSPPVVSLMATLKDASGIPQSVTTRPEVGLVNNATVVYVGTGRLLGKTDLQTPPPGNWSYNGSVYGLVDNGTNLGNPRAQASIVKQVLSGTTVLTNVSTNAVNIPTNLGWYVDFLTSGERVNVDPQLALGTLVVTSNIPITLDPCLAGGSSYMYQFNYASGALVTPAVELTTAMTVGNVIVQLPGGAVKIISTLSNGTQQTTGLVTSAANSTVRRVGWRVLSQ